MKVTNFLSLLPFLATGASAARYVANLGRFGRFVMETTVPGGSMRFTTRLNNMDELETQLVALGMIAEGETIESLNYHLHQQWTNADSDLGVGGMECGPDITGGHYDPYFGCGPASGQSTEVCEAIGRSRTEDGRYQCSGAYANEEYDRCEAGDLSGKFGPIMIADDDTAFSRNRRDPLPALDWHYEASTNPATPQQFASIVFHLGSPRVLCARLILIEE